MQKRTKIKMQKHSSVPSVEERLPLGAGGQGTTHVVKAFSPTPALQERRGAGDRVQGVNPLCLPDEASLKPPKDRDPGLPSWWPRGGNSNLAFSGSSAHHQLHCQMFYP